VSLVHLVRTVCAAVAVALLASFPVAAQVAPDPLLDAVQRGDLATARSLLQGRTNPNTTKADGVSALHLAAQLGFVEIAKHLVDSGADINAQRPADGYTPLHLAADAAKLEMVEFLLFVRANPSIVATTSGVTPLHLAAQALNGERVVRALIRRGATVDALDATAGQTPLMFAAAAGRAASVQVLLDAGADPAISPELVELLQRMR
jgi:ankyrin repeat protein